MAFELMAEKVTPMTRSERREPQAEGKGITKALRQEDICLVCLKISKTAEMM